VIEAEDEIKLANAKVGGRLGKVDAGEVLVLGDEAGRRMRTEREWESVLAAERQRHTQRTHRKTSPMHSVSLNSSVRRSEMCPSMRFSTEESS
jgi:hypothetical protein